MTKQFVNWRESLLQRARNSETTLEEATRESNFSVVEWEEVQRRQEYEYMERFDPTAGLQEEVALRLTGQAAEQGSIPDEWDQLLKHFRNALKDFSPKPLDIRMTGVSAGSTIIHFSDSNAPQVTQDDESPSGIFDRVHQTALADAAQELFKLVEAAEARQEVTEWIDRLDSFERFARELASNELEAGFRHYGSSGRTRGASLSKDGLRYIEAWADTEGGEKRVRVNGRVRELTLYSKENVSGSVRVKAGSARNAQSTTIEFPPSKRGMLETFRLGQLVNLNATRVFTVDRIGREETVKFVFDEDITSESRIIDI